MIGLGIDLCAVARIEAAIGDHTGFLLRYYTPEERAYLDGRGQTAMQSAAAMFAAKEAFLKALGVGLSGGIAMADVGVTHADGGRPLYTLAPRAQDALLASGAHAAHLSLTHDGGVAAAVCVLE